MKPAFRQSGQPYALYGLLALIFWGISPALICQVRHLPVFQLSMLLQMFSFLLTLGIAIYQKQLKKILFELPKTLIMVPFLVGTQVFYIYAFRLAPADQVDLINYLWPIMTVVGSSLLFSEKMAGTRCLGILLGFSAIVFLGRHEIFGGVFDSQFILGYLLAFATASSWTIYTLLGRGIKGVAANEHIGFHVGISAFVVTGLHLCFDHEFVPMLPFEWGLTATLGILVYGLGYPLWWCGLEKGRFALLMSLSYLSPILSIFVLVCTGVVGATIDLGIACLMVAGGSWLVNHNRPLFKKNTQGECYLHVISFPDVSREVKWKDWDAEPLDDESWPSVVASCF